MWVNIDFLRDHQIIVYEFIRKHFWKTFSKMKIFWTSTQFHLCWNAKVLPENLKKNCKKIHFLAKKHFFLKIIKLLLDCFLPKKAHFLPPLVKTKIYKNIKSLNINIITFPIIGQMGLPIYIYSCITLK